MRGSCSKDGQEGAALIDSLLHGEGLPCVVIPLEVESYCVTIEEVCECGELGILAMDDLQEFSCDTRLNISLRSRNTAALEGAWSFDCGTMMYFLTDSCMALMVKSIPWWTSIAQL